MQINSVNGQNAQQVQLKKTEKQQTEAKLQQQANQKTQTDNLEVQNLQTLLAKLDQEISSAETEGAQKGGGGSKPSGPPPDILAELNKYGLSPTGSKEGDEAAIAQAKQQAAAKKQGGQAQKKV